MRLVGFPPFPERATTSDSDLRRAPRTVRRRWGHRVGNWRTGCWTRGHAFPFVLSLTTLALVGPAEDDHKRRERAVACEALEWSIRFGPRREYV